MPKTAATKAGAPIPALTDLKPFLSATLMELCSTEPAKAVLEDVLATAGAIAPSGHTFIEVQNVSGDAWSGGLVYLEGKSPSWWEGGPEEIHRHLGLAFAMGKYIAICASDSRYREKWAVALSGREIAKPLTRKQMTSSFVGPEAKTVWLNGIHAPTAVKADAKMLSGQSLEFAIDPLGDHSYYLAALRSRPKISGLPVKKSARTKATLVDPSIGVAPGRSRVWLGRSSDWFEFSEHMIAILTHLTSGSHQVPAGLSLLADECDEPGSIGKPYAISLFPSGLLDEDFSQTPEQDALEFDLAYKTAFEITSSSKNDFDATVYFEGALQGSIKASIERLGNRWSVRVRETKAMAPNTNLEEIKKAIGRSSGLKIYFDEGKVFSDGKIFEPKFIDHPFNWTPHNFSNFDVHREKPSAVGTKLADLLVSQTDNSLFDFVRQHWSGNGMLACDDGSMELADFLHYDVKRGRIELIHVKAAGGGCKLRRQISVADYEIVTAQAIKNLRNLDKDTLIDRLMRSNSNDIARATWINGRHVGSRDLLINALKSAPQNISRGVTIIQPRLTMSEINKCRSLPRNRKKAIQFNQLNVLMLATKNAVNSLGAELTVMVDG